MSECKNACVIVAHPDDETLWCGGEMITNRDFRWEVIALCRKFDPDRSPRFFKALEAMHVFGAMADMDDGPRLDPLDQDFLQDTILDLLVTNTYDLVITHSPFGEYTQHVRHEEVSQAVYQLWKHGKLETPELRMFAYEDGGKTYLPRAIESAHHVNRLTDAVWQKKYDIITKTYNFPSDGFEAMTTPRTEAFWCLNEPDDLCLIYNTARSLS